MAAGKIFSSFRIKKANPLSNNRGRLILCLFTVSTVLLFNFTPGRTQNDPQPQPAAAALCDAGDAHFSRSRYREALAEYQKALAVENSDQLVRLRAQNGIAYMHAWLGENDEAVDHAQHVLQLLDQEQPSSPAHAKLRAQAINTLGEVEYGRRKLPESIKLFEETLPLWKQAGDRAGEALALLNIGYSHGDLGDFRKASDFYQLSLDLSHAIGDERGAALAQTALGGARAILGETQSALDSHNHSLEYFRQTGNKQGEAAALNGIATAYEDLNEFQSAIDNYQAALRLFAELGNERLVALNKFVVGRALFRISERDLAERSYLESLELSRKIGDRVIEASVLQSLAALYFDRGETSRALSHVEPALKIYGKLGNHRPEAYALNDRGRYLVSAGDAKAALASYQQALPLMRRSGDKRGEALTLFNLGKFERDRGDLPAAQSLIESSLAITESLHREIRNSQLRTSYFTSVQQQYELYTDVLMRLHRQFPDKGYATQALVANERSRARSLLASLLEGKIAKKDAAPGLASKELALLQALDEKAERQMQLLSRQHTQQEAGQLSEEIRALTIEYQDVRSQLKQQNPHHALLTETNGLRADDLQKVIADDDTLLLEFALGDDASYLWAVSRTGISSYELPDRTTIESQVRKLYELVTLRQSMEGELKETDFETIRQADSEYWRQAERLSTMLLGRVADQLGSRRLLIVADGSLQYIPFDALPAPSLSAEQAVANPEPLFLTHEVVSIPSALTLAALSATKNDQTTSSKTLAVFADPVFEKSDPRIDKSQRAVAQTAENAYLSRALRSFAAGDKPQTISRLPATMREANAIIAATNGEGAITTGLAATKEQVLSGGLKDYEILHFATHGLLNSEHPELSGLVLSLVDEQGNDRNGFVRVNDIYNLDLSADLIVLSACRTGLGKDVRGEGIIGLPGAFMYAGAKSIVASLWKVNDEATAELMGHFYSAMFDDGLSPSAALRKAKEKMWRQPRWRAPFYWGAFVFQGQYSNQIEVRSSRRIPRWALFGGILALSLGGALGVARAFKRRRRQRAATAESAPVHHPDHPDED